ncbi:MULTISPECIES: hypothetical protein [unclassified Actinomyces]|uniref:hypothetical protein n=1 Tax=unclassified Actinomyces TaxID=2609248 RepID=UPI002E2BBE4D|nr:MULTISPECIES: hypothetical protein [unclassified Actinomyces]
MRAVPPSSPGSRRDQPSGAGQRPSASARARSRARRRRLLSPLTVLILSFLITVLVAVFALSLEGRLVVLGTGTTPTPEAAGPAPVVPDMTGYTPSRIIDDEVFYDSQAMSEEEIAAFIARVNKGCVPGHDGTPCLADAVFQTQTREVSNVCPGGYIAAEGQSAARIISGVASACGINPRVLLVLIQKEQGLLTASGSRLTARDYEAATGYACPDGGQCDPAFAGFFAQLYGAAAQFQRYRLDPGGYSFVAGTPTTIAYSPDASCGSGEVTAANQATAGLYDYTPYLANDAAASGGDDCTTWGNWNFYGYYRTFFGSPLIAG